jgi:hypothetical protein
MKSMTKRIIRSGLVAAGLMTLVPVGAAVAGEWRLDARACPDLREDRRDLRRDRGRYDRREDRRDARVVHCPARAWYYVPDRYERRSDWRPARPREVIIYRDGRPYYRDPRGGLVSLNLNLRL